MGSGPAQKGRRRTKAEIAEAEARGRQVAEVASEPGGGELVTYPMFEDYFVVGTKPLKVGELILAPGEEIPQEVFTDHYRVESWERARRIERRHRPLLADRVETSA